MGGWCVDLLKPLTGAFLGEGGSSFSQRTFRLVRWSLMTLSELCLACVAQSETLLLISHFLVESRFLSSFLHLTVNNHESLRLTNGRRHCIRELILSRPHTAESSGGPRAWPGPGTSVGKT